MLTIVPTTTEALPEIERIFAQCKAYMRAEGNPHQWRDDYPTAKVVAADIEAGTALMCLDGDEVVGTFALSTYEEAYDRITEGAWRFVEPYVVIHRLATKSGRGVGRFVLQWLQQHYAYVRLDTHECNRTMQHLLTQYGFVRCGHVHYPGYSGMAFEWHR